MKKSKIILTGLLMVLLFSPGCLTISDSAALQKTLSPESLRQGMEENAAGREEEQEGPAGEEGSETEISMVFAETNEPLPDTAASDQAVSGSAEYAAEYPSPMTLSETEMITLDPSWEFAGHSEIHSGAAVLYYAKENRKDIVIGVNAGHGTVGGESVRTLCHPDGTPKVTGGSTAAGSVTATAVSSGTTFYDGTPEVKVTLREAQILRDLLLENGYDVLMLRDGEDVQLDNIARTVICSNRADCHIAIHWDGDGLDYDKGFYYMSVPDELKEMYPVSEIWQEDNRLGDCLLNGLVSAGFTPFEGGSMQMDLTQTSYSKVPSVDIELGNAASVHDEETLKRLAAGLLAGIEEYWS